MFPNLTELTVCFAHVAYPMSAVFAQRDTGIEHFQIWDAAELPARIGAADVLVVSGFWDDALLAHASRLRFIQAIGAGYNQFPLQELQARGIRLASAQGVNQNAVSEHAMAQLLSFSRKLHTGRDHQRSRHWRAMISQIDQREDELGGKTLLIYGLGGIGARLSRLAKAFDMRVIGVKRTVANAAGACDEVVTPDRLPAFSPKSTILR